MNWKSETKRFLVNVAANSQTERPLVLLVVVVIVVVVVVVVVIVVVIVVVVVVRHFGRLPPC